MTRRFLPLMAVLALLFAPFGMGGGGEAMAHGPAEAAVAHCEGMAPAEPDQDEKAIDCMIACAALPSVAGEAAFDPPHATAAPAAPALSSLDGTAPEAETPPPRSS